MRSKFSFVVVVVVVPVHVSPGDIENVRVVDKTVTEIVTIVVVAFGVRVEVESEHALASRRSAPGLYQQVRAYELKAVRAHPHGNAPNLDAADLLVNEHERHAADVARTISGRPDM